jgi:HNH endonuclease
MARPRENFEERFWKKVDKNDPNGCWIWRGALRNKRDGYGVISLPGKPTRYKMAHRVAYELIKGPIPEGFEIHHQCRVRDCVNPDHLEPLPPDKNIRHKGSYIAPLRPPRGIPNALKEVCSRCGKPYDYIHNRKRYCLSCIGDRQKQDPWVREYKREWQRKHKAEKKAKAIANGTYRAPGSAPGEYRGGGPKKWRTPEYIREQARLRQQRWRKNKAARAKAHP